nr:hypothetical protein [Tanacetum cinerariifolium]
MCDVHLVNNPTPLEAKDHFKIVINSNDDISSSDDDSLYKENIEYVEASPHNSKLVSLEVAEIVILEVEEIEDDNLVHLLIANIEALKDNPTPSSKSLTKSSSTSSKSFLEETNNFHNCLPEFENFYFDLEEISSGSTTTHSDISLSEYDSFTFDLVNGQFPPTNRSDFANKEFADELAHIISPPDIPGNLKTFAKGFYPPSLYFLSFNWESRTQSPSPLPPPKDTIVEATAEAATLPPRGWMLSMWIRYPPCTVLGALRKDYPEHVETLQATQQTPCEEIADLQFRLDESEDRGADLETCIRALKELFGPSAQCVADALTTYEANQNSSTRVNDGTSGSARGVEHTTRGRSYKEFLNCKPRNFNRTKGAVGLLILYLF